MKSKKLQEKFCPTAQYNYALTQQPHPAVHVQDTIKRAGRNELYLNTATLAPYCASKNIDLICINFFTKHRC